jgi:hypothetical protein
MLWMLVLALCGAAGVLVAGEFGLLFGPGLASILFFAAIALGAPPAAAAWAIAAALCAAAFTARRKLGALRSAPAQGSWDWLLAGALALAACFVFLDAQTAYGANPHGEWDASGIWNLRARFLAGGPETWRRAVSNEPGSFLAEISHPAYPLFLSSFVALLWAGGGTSAAAVPAAAGGLFAAGVLGALVASLRRRSTLLAAVAGLTLAATSYFSSQASAQYADLALAYAFLAALVLLDRGGDRASLLACGFAIGLAPWIKNEGQPFALAALGVAAWRYGRGAAWMLAGASPGLAATAAVKILSDGREAMFPGTAGEALAKAADPSRWMQVLAGFGGAVADAGPWWAHPAVFAAAIVFAAGFPPREEMRPRLWLGAPLAAVFAAEFGVYLITTSDLAWHLSTSVTRLFLQLWPAVLWWLFTMVRAPAEAAPPAPKAGKRGKRRGLS